MDIKTKRIIAREFLIFILAIGISIISFLLTFTYNYYLNNEIKKASSAIIIEQNNADSLMKPFELKKIKLDKIQNNIKDLYSIMNSSSLKGSFSSYEELSIYLSEEKNVKDIFEGIISYKEFKKLFLGYDDFFSLVGTNEAEKLTKSDSLNYHKGKILLEEINSIEKNKKSYYSKLLSLKEQLMFSLYTFFVLIIFLFIFRHIYYAIKWSFYTLKKNNNGRTE